MTEKIVAFNGGPLPEHVEPEMLESVSNVRQRVLMGQVSSLVCISIMNDGSYGHDEYVDPEEALAVVGALERAKTDILLRLLDSETPAWNEEEGPDDAS